MPNLTYMVKYKQSRGELTNQIDELQQINRTFDIGGQAQIRLLQFHYFKQFARDLILRELGAKFVRPFHFVVRAIDARWRGHGFFNKEIDPVVTIRLHRRWNSFHNGIIV